MSTAVDVDISVLVGELEAVPCEHSQHGVPGFAHDDGLATHYIESSCPRCGDVVPVRPVCSMYVSLIRSNGRMRCNRDYCGYLGTASEFATILGPVSGK